MAQRRFHYDQAFEVYLREQAIPYIAVDEAKRALHGVSSSDATPLKSFDFVVYSEVGPNLLVDVKGRKHTGRSNRSLENWVTQGDMDGMAEWERLFGPGFQAAFCFLYWCEVQPPDALFHDIFVSGSRWYAVLGITLADYAPHARQRSPKWETVSIPARRFHAQAIPFKDMLRAPAEPVAATARPPHRRPVPQRLPIAHQPRANDAAMTSWNAAATSIS